MNKRIFAGLLAALFCALCITPLTASAEAAEESTKKLPDGLTIACVGDSITYGSCSSANGKEKDDNNTYPGQLAALIGGEDAETTIIGGGNGNTCVTFTNDACTIYNDGKASTSILNDYVAGQNENNEFNKGALHVSEIMTSFERTDLDIVIFMLGTNDSKISDKRADKKNQPMELGNWDVARVNHDEEVGDILDEEGNPITGRPTPAQEFEARYRAILNKYFEMDSKPFVYCMLPIPSAHEGYDENHNYSKSYRISDKNMREEINPIITSIVEDLKAEGYPVDLIDMRAAFPDPTTEEGLTELKTLLSDYVHPNAEGYARMASTIYDRLLADTHSLNYIVEDADEGSPIPNDTLVFGNSTVTIKNTRGMITKDGVANIGWSTEPNGGGTIYNEGDEITFTADIDEINLYPVWGSAASGGIDAVTTIVIVVGAVAVIGLFAGGFIILNKNKKKD